MISSLGSLDSTLTVVFAEFLGAYRRLQCRSLRELLSASLAELSVKKLCELLEAVSRSIAAGHFNEMASIGCVH